MLGPFQTFVLNSQKTQVVIFYVQAEDGEGKEKEKKEEMEKWFGSTLRFLGKEIESRECLLCLLCLQWQINPRNVLASSPVFSSFHDSA